jgi:hypothetical protein
MDLLDRPVSHSLNYRLRNNLICIKWHKKCEKRPRSGLFRRIREKADSMADHSSGRWYRHGDEQRVGNRAHRPLMLFAVVILAGFALWTVLAMARGGDLVLPLVSAFLLCSAGLIAIVTWRHAQARDWRNVTYWDVAGALTLIGIGVAALVEPDQMVRLVESADRNN